MNERQRLQQLLLEKSYRQGTFTLTSGKTSDFYVDGKQTTLDAEGGYLCGRLLFELIRQHPQPIVGVGGMTLGADPLANALAVISYQRGRPVKAFTVRKESKEHGTKSRIEGAVKPGEKVAILDDVITTGGSTIAAIEGARAGGLVVDRVIALIDREEGGRENILKLADRVDAVFNRTDIMALYGKD